MHILKCRSYIEKFNQMQYHLWPVGWLGAYSKATFPIHSLIKTKLFATVMTASVIINTLVLAMYHHGISAEIEEILNQMNSVFTVIFGFEMILKVLGLGVKEYCRDYMNFFDFSVVTLSIFELIFVSDSGSAISAFRTFRIFRAVRVLRVARLFRYLRSLSMILKVIGASIAKFVYLAILLILFTVIFALIGMQIFGGNFEFPEGTPRANFDSFHWAFVTVFQILSMED